MLYLGLELSIWGKALSFSFMYCSQFRLSQDGGVCREPLGGLLSEGTFSSESDS
jgi:hypothetical protein